MLEHKLKVNHQIEASKHQVNWYLVLLTTVTIILNSADKSKSNGQSATPSKLTHKQFLSTKQYIFR
jgi:hypothetical protein